MAMVRVFTEASGNAAVPDVRPRIRGALANVADADLLRFTGRRSTASQDAAGTRLEASNRQMGEQAPFTPVTNPIESITFPRKVTKNRGHVPQDDARSSRATSRFAT